MDEVFQHVKQMLQPFGWDCRLCPNPPPPDRPRAYTLTFRRVIKAETTGDQYRVLSFTLTYAADYKLAEKTYLAFLKRWVPTEVMRLAFGVLAQPA